MPNAIDTLREATRARPCHEPMRGIYGAESALAAAVRRVKGEA